MKKEACLGMQRSNGEPCPRKATICVYGWAWYCKQCHIELEDAKSQQAWSVENEE